MLKYSSPAKVNLVLEILERRPDGYHELKSIVQTIGLYDTLYFEPAADVSLDCTQPMLNTPDNLVLRAARLLKEYSGYSGGAKIHLEKHIPWGAGLGGGSSNAATTLLALSRLWGLNLSTSEVTALAAKLGSDVPFFIHGGTALVEGRGERVTPLRLLKPLWLVLLVPPFTGIPGKTRRLYSLIRPDHYTKGEFVSRALESLQKHGEIAPSLMFNIFDSLALHAFPEIEHYWRALKEEAGPVNVHLAGSGPTLFTATEGRHQAERLATRLSEKGFEAFGTPTVPAPEPQAP